MKDETFFSHLNDFSAKTLYKKCDTQKVTEQTLKQIEEIEQAWKEYRDTPLATVNQKDSMEQNTISPSNTPIPQDTHTPFTQKDTFLRGVLLGSIFVTIGGFLLAYLFLTKSRVA